MGGTTTSRFLWCGGRLCQTRDSGDNALRRDLDEGELNVGTGQKLIYMPDQLHSVRDILDGTSNGLIAAHDYTPYGIVAKSYGVVGSDYGFAGLIYHPLSQLSLSTYRPLDGATGRFITRDPMRELAGINLYAYVESNPSTYVDPDGRFRFPFGMGGVIDPVAEGMVGGAIAETVCGHTTTDVWTAIGFSIAAAGAVAFLPEELGYGAIIAVNSGLSSLVDIGQQYVHGDKFSWGELIGLVLEGHSKAASGSC